MAESAPFLIASTQRRETPPSFKVGFMNKCRRGFHGNWQTLSFEYLKNVIYKLLYDIKFFIDKYSYA